MRSWPKWLRVVAWALGVTLALVALLGIALAASIWIDGRGSDERLAQVTTATIPNAAGPDVPAYVARPQGAGPFPVVIMVHEFWGLNPDIVSKADLLATEGYLVVAPNVFRSGTTGYLPRAIWQTVTTPAEEVNEDLDATLEWIRQQPDADASRIGITGFCFGGRTSLLYSLHNPSLQATSVFYGNPVTDPERLATLSGPVLGIFGGADTSIPLEDVRAFERGLRQAGVESTVTIYPEQPHAFVKNAEEIAGDPVQAKAWAQMVEFFDGALAEPAPTSASPRDLQPVGDFFGWAPVVRLGLGHAGHPTPWDETATE